MSRVTYTNIEDTAEQAGLREAHRVRLVTSEEEGTGLNRLPPSVFGFTYSPGIDEAPIFTKRSFRSYEAHKLADVDVTLIGFTSAESARQLTTSTEDISLQVQPHPEEGQDTLVEIPYSRIRQHKGYAAPNQHGFSVTVSPLLAHA
jgi:hypothetical protein